MRTSHWSTVISSYGSLCFDFTDWLSAIEPTRLGLSPALLPVVDGAALADRFLPPLSSSFKFSFVGGASFLPVV